MFKRIAVALVVSGFAISASAQEIPAPCKPIVKVELACARGMLSAAEMNAGAVDADTISQLKEMIGPNGVEAGMRKNVLTIGARQQAENCAKPEIRTSTAANMEGVAAAIGQLGGNPSPCLQAVGDLQNSSSAD